MGLYLFMVKTLYYQFKQEEFHPGQKLRSHIPGCIQIKRKQTKTNSAQIAHISPEIVLYLDGQINIVFLF